MVAFLPFDEATADRPHGSITAAVPTVKAKQDLVHAQVPLERPLDRARVASIQGEGQIILHLGVRSRPGLMELHGHISEEGAVTEETVERTDTVDGALARGRPI